jgi:DNA-binding PadR family transcriptional regulator
MRKKQTTPQDSPRLSFQGLLVLRAFMENPRKEFCGADLMKMTQLSSGTLYPILLRFERYGFLDSQWEEEQPSDLQRPRRRQYRITRSGTQLAAAALRQLIAVAPDLDMVEAQSG